MSAIRSFMRKIKKSSSLYLQLLFVTVSFALMVIASGIFVNYMLVSYLRRDAVNMLLQTQIRIIDELIEPETLMISIAKDVHDIIIHGGSADDVLAYCNEISAELYKKEAGFIFDGLYGFFEVFGNLYIPTPGWTVPDDYIATERPWYKAAVEAAGKITMSPIYMSTRSGKYQLSVACRIFNDKREPLGVIAMNLPLNNITQFISDMHLVEGGYGFLANENFILIAHHEEDFLTKHMREIGPGSRQIVETMEQGEKFAKVEGYNYKNIRSIFYCERMDNGWYLGLMTPRSVYYKDLTNLEWFLGALGIVFMLAVNIILIRIDAKKNKSDEALREQRVKLALMKETRTSDERLQLMIDAAPFGINILDKDYKIVDCNKATLTMFGMTSKDEYKEKFHQLAPEYQQSGELSDEARGKVLEAIFKEQVGKFEWTHQKPNGDLLPCEITFVRSTYKGQEIAIGYIRDLSKEREMQAARREIVKAIEEKNALSNLENILNGMDAMIHVTDPVTDKILFINDNLKRHYGIKDDVIGQICYKVFKKDLNEKCSFCPRFKLDKDPGTVIVWEELSELTGRVYRNVDRYIDWPNGKTAHLQHTIDINDLRTMTDTLNKRLEQQSLMTYISQSFLSNKDMDVLITEALRKIGEFMGIDQILMHVTENNGISFTCRNEWINPKFGFPTRVGGTFSIGKPILDIIQRVKETGLFYVTSNDPKVKEAVSPYRVNFQNYILTTVFLGDVLYAVIDFAKEGGDDLWSQNKINLAAYATNILIGALNKRTAELQLIDAKEVAEQSNRSKGIFLAHMSHEIRTPMNAILGISEIQLQSETLPTEAFEAFKQIFDSGNLLLNIINDILDFSKVEAGKLEIVPVKYDVPSLLNDTVQLIRLRYESKPIEFNLNLYNNTPLELFGDELRVRQILSNILSNAFKYTEKGNVELAVHAEQTEDDEKTVILIFRVSDTGQGMRKDQLDRLFDEYSRFNMQTNRGISGTGLGMSITKRLIDIMGGEIFVESEVGKGSTFTVRLPQKYIGSATCGAEVSQSLRNFNFHSMPSSKKALLVHEYMPYGSVLVVDDIVSNLYVAKGLLSSYGLRIETAASGTEAIEKIKNGGGYDIIFMDHMMPVMDGIETVKNIRKMGYTRTIIALTANAVVGQAEVFLENGFDAYISKPIDSRELNAMLVRFIRDKQPREVIEATQREQNKKNTEHSINDSAQKINEMSEIGKLFVLDAEKAIKVIEETYSRLHTGGTEALDSYIIAVHGIKNVLANIGETELSAVALKLEQAGNERDFKVITEETPAFIDALRLLINKLKPANNNETAEVSGDDTVYLRKKLLEIKTACEKFDIISAKDTLGEIRQKKWPQETSKSLDEISVHLLHSAFNKAAAAVETAMKNATEDGMK